MAERLKQYENSIFPAFVGSVFLIHCAAAAEFVFIITTLLSYLKSCSVLGYKPKLFMVYSVTLLYCNSLWNKWSLPYATF